MAFPCQMWPVQVQARRLDTDVEERRLRTELVSWRETAVAETDLQRSDFQREYRSSYYVHEQCEPKSFWERTCGYQCPFACSKRRPEVFPVGEFGDDDHHCPVPSARYVDLRLKGMIRFYQRRLPWYAWHNRILYFFSFVSVSLSSLLAFFEYTRFVIIGTAMSSAFSSWLEFSNVQQNIQRYSDTIQKLKNLESWWSSLSRIEKAAIPNIEHLVHSTEELINGECESWARALKQQVSKRAQWFAPQQHVKAKAAGT